MRTGRVFCKLSGHEELLSDPRFKTLALRVANIDDTYQETAKIMLTRTTAEWLELFSKTSVPTNMVNTLQGLKDDPHLNAVGFWQEVDHPTEGRLRMTRYPVTFSETPASVRRLQPRLGEHTVEVLRETGLADAEIQSMLGFRRRQIRSVGRSRPARVLRRQAVDPQHVVAHQFATHLGLEAEFVDVLYGALERQHREVGAEDHLVLALRR